MTLDSGTGASGPSGPSGASGASGAEGASGASGAQETPGAQFGDLPIEADAPPTTMQSVNAINGTPVQEEDELHTIDRLVEESEAFFKQPPFVVAGALWPARQAGAAELTVAQGQAAINAWLEAPV